MLGRSKRPKTELPPGSYTEPIIALLLLRLARSLRCGLYSRCFWKMLQRIGSIRVSTVTFHIYFLF